jgi:hypothetical protein
MPSHVASLRRFLPVIFLLACVFLVCVLLVAARKLAFAPRRIHVRWDYDYKHDPPCSSRWAPNCIQGFYVFVGGAAERLDGAFVENRFDGSRQVVGRGLETDFQVHEFGYLRFCVVAVKQGPMATTVESAPICRHRWVLPTGITRRHWK